MHIRCIAYAVKVNLLQFAVDESHGFGMACMICESPKWTSGEAGIHCGVAAVAVALRLGKKRLGCGCMMYGCIATAPDGCTMGICTGAVPWFSGVDSTLDCGGTGTG